MQFETKTKQKKYSNTLLMYSKMLSLFMYSIILCILMICFNQVY